MFWLSRPLRWTAVITLALLVGEIGVLVVIGQVLVAIAVPMALAAVMTLAACIVVADAVFRLVDRNRLVLLSRDRQVSIDVVFRRNGHVSLAEHARLIGATRAGALRTDVAEWISTLDAAVDVRTWNASIAALCVKEFPELHVRGRDGIGRIRLVRGRESPASAALSRIGSAGNEPVPAQPPRS